MMRKDAAALIRQLTAERDAALHDIDILRNKPLCAICDYGYADRLPECRERYDKRGVHKCYKWRGLCAENSGG
jgi:hypothetical protein